MAKSRGKFGWRDVGEGALYVGAGAGAGALLGYATAKPDDLLTPGGDAQIGGLEGAATVGIGGLLVAAVSPAHRNTGLGAASAFGLLIAAAWTRRLLTGQPALSAPINTTPATTPATTTSNPLVPNIVPTAVGGTLPGSDTGTGA